MQEKIWKLYPALTMAVERSHREAGARFKCVMFYCHDFDHVLRVADRAMIIAPDPYTGHMAGVAALCHNADRLLQREMNLGAFRKVDDARVRQLVEFWLSMEPLSTFSVADICVIVDAVLHHPERNSPTDSSVLMTLKDADRTVNIEADVIFRKGQYFGDALPTVDPTHLLNDPDATFTKPGSLLKSLEYDLVDFATEGGVASLRLPKAREIAERRFKFLKLFIDEVIEQRRDSGLIPYPTFE